MKDLPVFGGIDLDIYSTEVACTAIILRSSQMIKGWGCSDIRLWILLGTVVKIVTDV